MWWILYFLIQTISVYSNVILTQDMLYSRSSKYNCLILKFVLYIYISILVSHLFTKIFISIYQYSSNRSTVSLHNCLKTFLANRLTFCWFTATWQLYLYRHNYACERYVQMKNNLQVNMLSFFLSQLGTV